MTDVIVNADDYGIHQDINRGILFCVEQGLVNSVSVGVCGMAADAGELEKLRRLQGQQASAVRIGVHLMLVDGKPLTNCASCRTPSGTFPAHVNDLARRWASRRLALSDIEQEWRAQIQHALSAGFVLSHLDSHQHVHLLPGLWECCAGLADEFGIARVRSSYQSVRGAIRGLHLRQVVLQTLARTRYRRGNTRMKTFGVLHSGAFRLQGVIGELDRELDRGLPIEVMTHPGFESEELRRKFPEWNASWSSEIEELKLLKRFLEGRRESLPVWQTN